jgi:hypothetical protein
MILMLRSVYRIVSALAFAGIVSSASAFALLGQYATWESAALSYNGNGVDIGGPMNLGEGYRWNIKTIYYGFDKSFQDYFGQRGMDEINKAISILNNLPPVSQMSSDLHEFPMDTRRINYAANALGLYDLKTFALGILMEEYGLADAERYVWTLRSRFVNSAPPYTNYWVIMRNFDPGTWNPTPYVNGILYSYNIIENGAPQYSDAQEFSVDPLALAFNSVSGIADSGLPTMPSSYLTFGTYFTGLTRDDVGAIRYLLNKQNINVENLLPNTTGGGGGAWGPAGGGGTLVTTALRGGVDRIVFKQINFYGLFPGFTNIFTDTYYTNSHRVNQRVQRTLTDPDIVFTAGDLGVDGFNQPFLITRTGTAGWANNALLNNAARPGVEVDGPGVIQPTAVIAFSNVGPLIENRFPFFMDQADQIQFWGGWAAIDGTTNAPYIFPNGASIQQLQQLIFSGGGQ